MKLTNIFRKSINTKMICILCMLSTVVLVMLVLNIFALKDMRTSNEQMNDLIHYYEKTMQDNDIALPTESQAMIDRLLEHTTNRINGTMIFDYILMGVWCVVLFIVIQIVKRIIITPISEITEELHHIITKIDNECGDLTERIETKNTDEIGKLASGINSFIENLQRIISKIKRDSKTINKSATEMEKSVTEANQNVLNVVALAEELSAGVEETTATLVQLESGSNQILSNVQQMNNEAISVSKNMLEVKDKAERLKTETEESKKESDELISALTKLVEVAIEECKSVEQINKLTGEILNISSQTNLLSLNASIEAARAGEFGKGFSVVANEIRQLSEQTKNASNNINEINKSVTQAVEKLSDSASKMIELMNTSVSSDYDKFVDIARQYKEDASNISKVLGEFSTQTEDITKIMSDMNNGLHDITVAMDDSANSISSVADDTSELANAISLIKDEVTGNKTIADELERETSKFTNV